MPNYPGTDNTPYLGNAARTINRDTLTVVGEYELRAHPPSRLFSTITAALSVNFNSFAVRTTTRIRRSVIEKYIYTSPSLATGGVFSFVVSPAGVHIPSGRPADPLFTRPNGHTRRLRRNPVCNTYARVYVLVKSFRELDARTSAVLLLRRKRIGVGSDGTIFGGEYIGIVS